MIEFILAFLIIGLVVLGMSVGVLYGRQPLQGSCGGINNFGIDGACEICGGNPDKCESTEVNANTRFYQAETKN